MVFDKIVVANRGEIALRIIRACRELDIQTVAVFSEADEHSLHRKLADESFPLGDPDPPASYLNVEKILSICHRADCQAIHPGYGFLAEDPGFASACEESGIVFIGPPSESLRTLGDKISARGLADERGIPVIPGSCRPAKDADDAAQVAAELGYPVLVKASGGGGGRGMRFVRTEVELRDTLELASREAAASFGNPDVYLEKVLRRPRHIEVQTLTDSFGNVRHFFERECSIQRRHQKILEESPSPTISSETRESLVEYAVRLIEGSGYTNVGTVEFLVDASGSPYFLEVNSRIQVEHPVTEEVVGIDLVKEQILVSAGNRVSVEQKEITTSGHAIECRIYAENPYDDFSPSPGTILTHVPPGGDVRVETDAHTGWTVSPYYDTLISKVIAWGRNRSAAVAKMRTALREYRITGIRTTLPLHGRILESEEFIGGRIDTGFLERNSDEIFRRESTSLTVLAAAALYEHMKGRDRMRIDTRGIKVSPWRSKGREELHRSRRAITGGW